ncbi:MAG: hypothetical protein JWM27_3400 [Gemmatimonadetes bacterium]|nr:hypothetical protein [Gemmatimonadota bacterium]
MLASAAFPVAPLRDAVTLGDAPGATLRLTVSHVATAPFSDLADAVSLLTVRQHVAFLLTILLAFVAWRVIRKKARASVGRRAGAEALAGGGLLLGVLAFYAAAVLMSRPMAALGLADADELAADFHTHTRYSHDGRAGLTPRRVRAWHRAAGYDVAYVTDHRTLAGAAEALETNPARAGEGTSLFSGIELISGKLHLNVLGAAPADSPHFRLRVLGPDSVGRFRPADGSDAVILLTIPGDLHRVRPAMRIGAVEVSDAAPRGLEQTQAEHAEIVRLADTANLALLAASDNHGWGQTAAAWSVLRVPGWRDLPPPALDRAIRRKLATERRAAARAVERRRPDLADSPLGIAGTAPQMLWLMLRTLSWPERASWLAWTWAAWGAAELLRRRRG